MCNCQGQNFKQAQLNLANFPEVNEEAGFNWTEM
jgi:hypothetical protein